MPRPFAVACCLAILVLSAPGRAQEGGKQAAPEQPPPRQQPFRSGAHYVLVDAYPSRDGKPILGLTADDFELLEDGKPQTIDRLEFIEHAPWTPLGERRDPNSQRAGFELAQNPAYRVFVLYLDAFHVDFAGGHRTKVPIKELLNRMMGPQDLFGVLTPVQTPKDLLLGQLTQSIEEQLDQLPMWGLSDRQLAVDQIELDLEAYFPTDGKRLVALRRLDKVYADLEELIERLGALREERKNIIFFSDFMPSPPSNFRDIANPSDKLGEGPGNRGNPPPIGVGPTGKLTLGETNARMGDRRALDEERNRLMAIDYDIRFRSILQRARQTNVAFYTVRPAGLDMNSSSMNNAVSNLRVLAEQTDGIAVLDTNDLRGGMKKISDDLSSHYVLGYYTNNTKWDGRPRKLTVRLKATRQTIRARREYKGPTEAEIAAIAAARNGGAAAGNGGAGGASTPSAGDTALSALSRLRPAARVQAYGVATGPEVSLIAEIAASEIEEGRWKQGAAVEVALTSPAGSANATGRIEPGSRGTVIQVPVGDQPGPWQAVVKIKGDDPIPESDTVKIERSSGKLVGRPLAYRAASVAASPFRPLAAFNFRRTERVRLDWPVLQALDSHSARLLDRTGKPLPVPVTLATRETDGKPTLSGTINLAPLSIGDYLIELSAKAGDTTEQQIIAIRVNMAR
jgi:VWFA-related protein